MKSEQRMQRNGRVVASIAMIVAVVVSMWSSPASLAQCDVGAMGSVLSSDISDLDQFGNAMAASGNVAVVGAHQADGTAGAAYVLRFDGFSWQEEAKLVASDATIGDSFGNSVAIDGDLIVVGAWDNEGEGDGDLRETGAAYVFRYDGADWNEETRLTAYDHRRFDHFGSSVSVHGDVVIVGAYGDDDPAIAPEYNSGSAYIYRHDGAEWGLDQKIAHADPHANGYFGLSTAIAEDMVFVGTPGDNDAAGSVYLFTYNGANWSQQTALTPSDSGLGDEFGFSVSLYGNSLLVGAWRYEGVATDMGAAFLFQDDGAGWLEEAVLTAGDAASHDRLGRSVALGDGFAIVGSYFDDDDGNKSGSAYMFRPVEGEWVQDHKFTAFDAVGEDQFGFAVAVSGDKALIGAQLHDAVGTNSGQVYAYNGLTDCTDPCETGALAKLTSPNPQAEYWFGYAVDVSGDVAVISTPLDSDVAQWAGSVYVYRFDGLEWLVEAELTASDPEVDDEFGIAVAIDGDVIVVGALRDDEACPEDPDCNSGSAYVFRYDGANWNEETKLLASNADAYDDFGLTVAIDGDVIAVGADQDGNTGPGLFNGHGAAYVFRYNGANWNEESKLLADDGEAFDHFGFAIGVSGDVVLVGASADAHSGMGLAGSAYVYEFNGGSWDQTAKLTSSDVAPNDQFGKNLSISGDVALIGALLNDASCPGGNACNAGAAYIFEKPEGGWVDMNETAQLTASDADGGDSFGWAVSISGETAIVGAYGDEVWTGAAYVFEMPSGGWVDATEDTKYTSPDGVDRDFFGYRVAIDGDTAIIGSFKDDDNCPGGDDCDTGTAFMLAVSGVDCNGNGIADACDFIEGILHDDDENGIPDECELECPVDLDGDGTVSAADLAQLLGSWGPCDGCPADFNGDALIDAADLAQLLGNWGPCQ